MATHKVWDDVAVWDVRLSNDDWYYVFARSAKEALAIVIRVHYDGMPVGEFRKTYSPKMHRIPDGEPILVNDETRGQTRKTAKKWTIDQSPGVFCSNTYEV